VEKPYNRTEIGDEVQMLELAKFRYPDGYFATENGYATETAAGIETFDPFAPRIISEARNEKPEPSPSPSPSPGASPAASPAASVVAVDPETSNANKNSAALTPEQAQTALDRTAQENNLELPAEAEVNKQVLKDFAAYANDLKKSGKLDLNQPFEIVIEAELGEDGKLKNPRFTKKAGDPNLVDLFARFVAALNDSGFLVYLKPINKDNPGAKVVFTIKQGESDVLATVESEVSSPDNARVLAKALNAALVFGAGSRAGKDEAVIMRNTNATPDGKKVMVNFSMPRQSVVDLIKRSIEPGE
ncbi:MAG TPA: hypothetical protein VL866_21095, partial [Pyrinomonadaceae bacterium]|nr:hypothetical protein [Pyrinomonadaceae bacterium]